MTYPSMTAFKAANRAAGFFFFSKDTMRFFRSKVESDLLTIGDRQFFVTSEQFVPSDGPPDDRKYTVREAMPGGDVNTIGEFQEHFNKDAALLAIYDTVEAES
jgi:hypothetical protein